ncbi:PEGA domain-containing protein [Salidesulfovibrio brasiliensis]|uniref:PEGA domain-containing protein n=1 Tax=Salidesulfovibrio brasiliensis TaxID=221711 RepID=UPI0006CFC243|nr:PEGA domain-containing protein [Salidesulfovibrio brasiliensis]
MKRIALLVVCVAVFMGGCQAQVYKQSIPVSTDPMGADVLVDGTPSGTTPTTLDLPRNQDHILTITKQGYRQEDVTIKRVYQAESAMLNAVSSGVSDADFFKNDSMGLQSGVNQLEYDKESGKAYTLTPGTVKIKLMPVGGIDASSAPQQQAAATKQVDDASSAQGATANSPSGGDVIATMSTFDREMLDRVLEKGKSGEGMGWTSPSNGWHFHIVPEPAQMMDGVPVRTFKVIADKSGKRMSGKYPAYRENRNDWRIGYPHQVTSGQPDVAPVNERAAAFGALKAAASGIKPVEGTTKMGGSSHSSESWGKDGSYTKKTSKSSVSGSVSVDPSGAVDLLEKLTEPSEGGE